MTPFIHCKKAEIPGNKGMPTLRAAVSHAPTGGLLLSLPGILFFPLISLSR